MGYALCMTEKLSVAYDIAKVIGANRKCDGYWEGNGYRVTWALGHLVNLAEPEAYGYTAQKEMKEYPQKAMDEIPLIPNQFKLALIDRTKSQFFIIKKLIHADDTDYIINCGDMGPEGHILQWFIRLMANCDKPVKRFCATSMTEEAIHSAMQNLRPEQEFSRIIKGEFCKKKADWILGMSLSRVETLKYHVPISVGRVQSPTLYFVVKRYVDVKNWQPTIYYTLDLKLSDFHVYWDKDTEGIFLEKDKTSDGKIINSNVIESKVNEIRNAEYGIVTNRTTLRKKIERPQLYDIAELQRDANRIYGYTASQTLAAAQILYERYKILTYPRTDSKYLTSDLVPYMNKRIQQIGSIEKYQKKAERVLQNGLNIDHRIVNDQKITDHHALLVTEKIQNFDIDSLTPQGNEKIEGISKEMLQNILDLVIVRMLVSFSEAYLFEETIIEVQICGMTFCTKGKKTIREGYREIEDKKYFITREAPGKPEEQTFPDIKEGMRMSIEACYCCRKETTAPKLHTEATLLTAMENAGTNIENGKILKGKGIGTQATRAAIIKKLFEWGYITTEKKGNINYLIPTNKGIFIIKVLPKDLYSPKITADWETRIAKIVDPDDPYTDYDFMREFEQFITEKVKEVKNNNTEIIYKKEVYGKCPWCGHNIYRYRNPNKPDVIYYCSEKNCNFFLKTSDITVRTWTGKNLTEQQICTLIKDGSIVLTCRKKTGNGTYRERFQIVKKEKNGRVFANLRCEFNDKKGQKKG
jgi:DNA topoisomerase-3